MEAIAKLNLCIFITIILLATSSTVAVSGSSTIRRGSTVSTKSYEISGIESKRLENDASGLIYYSFKARVRNRTNKKLKATFYFQAVDRNGYEREDVVLYDKSIEAQGTAVISDRLVIKRSDYDAIWEWKFEKIRFN